MVTLATDSFTRANAANLGANWTIPANWSGIGITSNAAVPIADPGSEFYNAATWPNDQYSQAVVTIRFSSGVTGGNTGTCVRYASTASGQEYFCAPYSDKSQLFKVTGGGGGTYTQLGSDAAGFAVNDVVRTEAQGTTIRLLKNGSTLVTQTDSSLTSGSAGLNGSTDGVNNSAVDDWEGGDFSSGGLPPGLGPAAQMQEPAHFDTAMMR